MGTGESLEEVFTSFCNTFPSKTVMTNAIWVSDPPLFFFLSHTHASPPRPHSQSSARTPSC